MAIAYGRYKRVWVCDTECYTNYWCIGFLDVQSGEIVRFELLEGDGLLDMASIAAIFRENRIVTFNGNNYDMPMIALAMAGASNAALKGANDRIIGAGLKPWHFYREYEVDLPPYIDHIDLVEVSPGSPQRPGLKLYAGRLNCIHMQDLPYPPDSVLTDAQIKGLRKYHDNDLIVTHELYRELEVQVNLRARMSDEYGMDLRSKSDAQIAEAVIRSETESATGKRLKSPEIKSYGFKYVAPEWIQFETAPLKQLFGEVMAAKFFVGGNGVIQMPTALKDRSVAIGDSAYRLGIGGLHSSEEAMALSSDEHYMILDNDVTGFYPSLIIAQGLYPKSVGLKFLEIFKRFHERRVAAKRSGDKATSETLKIVENGCIGKFGSPYSVLYAPELFIQTTVTGELAVLMVIEAAEKRGFSVKSANTDGFVARVRRADADRFRALVVDWEWATGLNMEETEYKALYARDVNNYIAIKNDGGVKRKGAYSKSGRAQPGAAGLKKNPQCDICVTAAIECLLHGTSVGDTIRACDDITQFVAVTRVTGGAYKSGEYIGRAIRWYYAKGETGFIANASGDTVPRSQGAKPALYLPEDMPEDLDYMWYEREALAILNDVGVKMGDPWLKPENGIVYARLPKLSTYHIVDGATGVALCGKEPASFREGWIPSQSLPNGAKCCAACERRFKNHEL
jgi:hypothetical protein